jgi:hypothetical protein
MRVSAVRLVEIGVALVGFLVLLYSEIVTSRTFRVATFVVVTVCVVVAAILAAFRDDER